jgi:membrane-bound ClpP family serine protease
MRLVASREQGYRGASLAPEILVPIAIALLHHPVGAYTFLVIAIAGVMHGGLTRRFVPLFAGVCAALLAVLAFMATPPGAVSVLLLTVGVVLLNVELRLATFGVAGLAGGAATFAGSLTLLAPSLAFATVFDLGAVAVAGGGTMVLALAVYGAQRRITLPR